MSWLVEASQQGRGNVKSLSRKLEMGSRWTWASREGRWCRSAVTRPAGHWHNSSKLRLT